ncbi:unnamed protein product [Prunus armeniaca]|uniref:Secreted protein n=1 Tax=Prunus armeniaca TaxID=36596 RepID=A0A6J5THS5_PRUAR|nr:unnamed protein product [Prunus armeniaca]CAB4263393.1 unnamed protein product [Prunus armeniaca]CAB4279767.1 unnamed protein product [Prunus armeniaca]CAB4289987.1 unnamed protein product [Prunus armeniaca]CAB4293905.1 unnamed protein product [Prunus armeniaca]
MFPTTRLRLICIAVVVLPGRGGISTGASERSSLIRLKASSRPIQTLHPLCCLGRNGSSEGGNFLQSEYLLFHRDCMPTLGINHFTGENTRDERRSTYLSFY